MKNTITWVIVAICALFLFTYKGCDNTPHEVKKVDTIHIVDTVFIKHDSLVIKHIPVFKNIQVLVTSKPEYLPDTSYPKLKDQYNALVRSYISKRVYMDSIKIDKWGTICITDTIQENKLLSRKYQENYKIPTVKETIMITKYAPPVRQLYVGGGINAAGINIVKGAEAGILYKTKKDQILGVTYNVNVDGTTSFGMRYYTKIKLKR